MELYVYQYKLQNICLSTMTSVDTFSLVCSWVGLSAGLGLAVAGRFADSPPAAAGRLAGRRFGGRAATRTSGPKLSHLFARFPVDR